ncbi:MAG: DUF4926 domain-containing protein [Deltaproteobacteria bacterium]|nr:DUF4926 domain-containing protein [Deltaproteobacteria bacterium]
MFKELDTVVLTHDIEKNDLRSGDVGAIVHCYTDAEAYEVEFVTAEGKTVSVLTLSEEEIRSMSNREILHVREIVKQAA